MTLFAARANTRSTQAGNGRSQRALVALHLGVTEAEIRELDAWIKANTIERFGPVRSVPRVQVFELAFEGIARSSRHKSGVAVRFPRIKRWRRDKPAEEADALQSLEALIDARCAGEAS